MFAKPLFTDRGDAGRKLAAVLANRKMVRPIVLGLPRGGVPVAAEVAAALGAPLNVIVVRKIGAPGQPELALGAVVDAAEPIVVVNEGVAPGFAEFVAAEAARQIEEIARRRARYGGAGAPDVRARDVVVVDDGVATGASMRAALRALALAGARRVVAAIPVAPAEAVETLSQYANEVVCLATPRDFRAVGLYYVDFAQVSDEEVVALLRANGEA